MSSGRYPYVAFEVQYDIRKKIMLLLLSRLHRRTTAGGGGRTYQNVSVPVNILVSVEELAVVRDADEQRAALRGPRPGRGRCGGEL